MRFILWILWRESDGRVEKNRLDFGQIWWRLLGFGRDWPKIAVLCQFLTWFWAFLGFLLGSLIELLASFIAENVYGWKQLLFLSDSLLLLAFWKVLVHREGSGSEICVAFWYMHVKESQKLWVCSAFCVSRVLKAVRLISWWVSLMTSIYGSF